MKRIINFSLILLTAIAVVSCSSTSSSTSTSGASSASSSTQTAAYKSGKATGTSLIALNKSYKQTGKVDLTDPTTLSNIVTLATNTKIIKSSSKDSKYYKDFSKGLIDGSNNLVTTENIDKVIGVVKNLNLTTIVEAVASNKRVQESQAGQVATSLIELYKLFK